MYVPVVVSIRDNNIILSIDRDTAGLRKLALQDPELAELAVVDHLLPLDLRLGRVQRRHVGSQRRRRQVGARHELGRQVDHVAGRL